MAGFILHLQSWLQLTKQPELAKNPKLITRFIVCYINSAISGMRWMAFRERFHFKNFNPVLSAAESYEYAALLQRPDVDRVMNKLTSTDRKYYLIPTCTICPYWMNQEKRLGQTYLALKLEPGESRF